MEDDTALDDKKSLGTDGTGQEAVLSSGGNVSKELEQVRANKKAVQAKRNFAAGQLFMFYVIFLSKDARYQWDKIVALQVHTAPWTNVRCKEQPKACVKSYLSLWTV